MTNMVHPLLTLLALLSRQELAQQVRYLKAENEILRSKSPSRITLDNREHQTLGKHGEKLGGKIKKVMSIVSYWTLQKWVRSMAKGDASALETNSQERCHSLLPLLAQSTVPAHLTWKKLS